MSKAYESAALGSDIARSRKQYWMRRIAATVVKVLGLNRPKPLATEIVQAINPIATINTRYGPLYCKTGHGRLLWRAESFFTEEPGTIEWLDRLQPSDVLYDIGSNVGLYAIYAAKFRKCQVVAFEPEAQNYALLLENIALNDVGNRCLPANLALTRTSQLGRLRVRYITKGGAYNMFRGGVDAGSPDKPPESFLAAQKYEVHSGFDQVMFACSVDDLVFKYGLPAPTHLKIDVDGLEPEIVAGAIETVKAGKPRSMLIELNTKSAADMAVPDLLASYGFKRVSERSNWDSREDKTRAVDLPAVNMILERA
jgi:FkbM family methyltransferase